MGNRLREHIRKHRMLYELAAAAAVISVLAVLVIFFSVNAVYRSINVRREAVENEAIAGQISEEIHQIFYEINDMSLSIYADPVINDSVRSVYYGSDSADNWMESFEQKGRIREELGLYLNVNEEVDFIQIYIRGQKDPVSAGDVDAPGISRITREYQEKYQERVREQGGEMQTFTLQDGKIVFARALGDINSGVRNKETYYEMILLLSDRAMSRILDKLYYSNYSSGKMICLVNGGIVVNSTKPQHLGRHAAELGMAAAEEGTGMKEIDGERCLCTVRTDGTLGCGILVATELEEIDLYAQAAQRSFLIVPASMLLVFAVVSLLLVLFYVRPVQNLINSVEKVGNDEMQVRVVDVGEGGDIALSFNQAIRRMEGIIRSHYEHIIKERDARITILQLQINPHFIFNTLDTISWSVFKDEKEEALKMISAFGKILRYTTYNYNKYVTLREELGVIRNHLYLNQVRYGGFSYRIEVEEGLEEFRIPCLLLQPIAENSCKHGLRGKEDGTLSIDVRRNGGFVQVTIEDNGCGMTEEEIRKACASPSEDGEHMGIANVKERLETCFGPEAGFVIESEPGSFMRTRITIPMEEEADAENSDRGR